MKRILLFVVVVNFIAAQVYAQEELDAFRFSRNDPTGSARGVAMGGAFGALGGDVTGIAQNPAGIGVYRSSELTGTMDFSSTNIKTNFEGLNSEDSRFKFAFDNLSYVGYFPNSGNIKSFNLGFSYNRLKNFDRTYQASGKGLGVSLTNYIANYTTRFADNSNIIPDDLYSYDKDGNYNPWPYEQGYPWISVLGVSDYLIDYDEQDKKYISPLHDGETVNTVYTISEEGHIESYDFTGGMNISDKLYLGMTLSITDVKYTMNSRHGEWYADGGGFDLDNYLRTDGEGFQFSVGAIYRPVDEFRLGLAYHSPIWYNLTDFYEADVFYEYYVLDQIEPIFYDTHTPYDASTPYQIQTPDRWVLSAAGIIAQKAIVSLDYEYSDYSKMKIKNVDGFSMTSQNNMISEDFKGTSSLRLGLEYKVTPRIALRAGYAYLQSPLEKSFKNGEKEVIPSGTVTAYTLEGDATTFSYGGGYRFTPNLSLDIAFSFKKQTNDLYLYSPIYTSDLEVYSYPIEMKDNTYRGLLTLGYKF